MSLLQLLSALEVRDSTLASTVSEGAMLVFSLVKLMNGIGYFYFMGLGAIRKRRDMRYAATTASFVLLVAAYTLYVHHRKTSYGFV